MGNLVWNNTSPPIHGYRRVQDCGHHCPIATVEVDKTPIEELIRLRAIVNRLGQSVELVTTETDAMQKALNDRDLT